MTSALAVLVVFASCLGGQAMEGPRFPTRWNGPSSNNVTCTKGVCGQGAWIAYWGGLTESECKAKCESDRELVPEPDGLLEQVYTFRQNGHFHAKPPGAPRFERKVSQVNYRGTGSWWDSEYKKHNIRDHFYAIWTGYVVIQTAGEYTFYTISDDGSKLSVNEKEVVSNPGWHGMRQKEGKVTLSKGRHKIRAEMFEGGGGAGMEIKYKGPDSGDKQVIIPPAALASSLQPSSKYMRMGTRPMCEAYSHKGSDCITYSSCTAPGDHPAICQDKGFDWVGAFGDFQTCVYPAHPPIPPPPMTDMEKAITQCETDDGSVMFGDRFLQIGEWRFGDVDGDHFSMSHKGGRTAQIYTKDGKTHGGRRDTRLGTWHRKLGYPKGITFGDNFIQIGDWRLADSNGQLVVAHKDGKIARAYKKEGRPAWTDNQDGTDVWKLPAGTAKGLKIGDKMVQIGDFILGDVDGWHASVSNTDKRQTAMIFRGDGTLHGGSRHDWGLWTRHPDKVCSFKVDAK